VDLYEATITSTATSVDDDVTVVIRDFDNGDRDFGPVAWMPRVDDDGAPVYPAAGDWAAVAETLDGTWCVLVWTST
jgi:hypothetical protein